MYTNRIVSSEKKVRTKDQKRQLLVQRTTLDNDNENFKIVSSKFLQSIKYSKPKFF